MDKFCFILIFLAWTGCSTDNVANWQVGKFYYKDEPYEYEIQRFSNYQIESIVGEGFMVKFDLEWLNDSMYILSFDSILANPKNLLLPSDIHKLKKTCTIISESDTSYVERTRTNLNPNIHFTQIRSR